MAADTDHPVVAQRACDRCEATVMGRPRAAPINNSWRMICGTVGDAFRAGFVLPLLTLVRPVESDDEPPAAWLRILVGSARGTADAVLTAIQKYDASALTAARAP